MKSYIIRVIAGIFALMFMLINFSRDDIFADEWSEPVKFYNRTCSRSAYNIRQLEKADL